jgi:DNA-binding LacI/PurR family transcriptional regulator
VLAKPVSIKDIARMAGVTHSTVSRALRDSPLVNRETVQRIQRIASDAGYRPSAAARSLVNRRSDTIGVVVTNIADPFVAGVVSGIEEMADQNGLSVFLANSNAEPEREVRVARKFEERRVDGIIVTASRVGAQYVPLFTHMQVPIVLLNNQHPSQSAHSVMIANTQASMDAVRHLIALGHRRIAYLGDRYGHQSDTERFSGYRQALQEGGLPYEPVLVAHGDGKPEGAEIAVARLIALHRPPTAIFFYNDMSALGGMRQIRNYHLRIPADISVVGFDDLYISQYLDPPLTTVRQPMRQMGRMAMESLLQIFAGAESGHDIKVPGELIVRQSTAPPQENQ